MAIIHALATWPAIEWRAPANSAAWPSALARAARLPALTRPHRSSSHCAPSVKLWRSLRKESGISGIFTPNCAMFSWLADKPPLRPICGNCSAPAIFACAQAASSRAAALQTSGLVSRACPIASLNRHHESCATKTPVLGQCSRWVPPSRRGVRWQNPGPSGWSRWRNQRAGGPPR